MPLTDAYKPGQMYNANKQCELMHGSGYQQIAPTQDHYDGICYMMWCGQGKSGRIITSHPALEGTFCGPNKWCQLGRCVPWSGGGGAPPLRSLVSPPQPMVGYNYNKDLSKRKLPFLKPLSYNLRNSAHARAKNFNVPKKSWTSNFFQNSIYTRRCLCKKASQFPIKQRYVLKQYNRPASKQQYLNSISFYGNNLFSKRA